MAEPAIEVIDLSKRFKLYTERRDTLRERFVRGSGSKYEEFWALRNVGFEIERGSTFGLIGHNGSGKSTLLKMIAGIHRPTSGSVVTRGRISALLELGAGFHPELSGRDNVYLNGAILGLSRKQVDASVDEIIEFAGIDEFIDSPVKVYSSGMVVRLGFSIAIKVDPEILIVDEVITVGDEEFQRKCMDHLFKLRTAGTTIVLVSHAHELLRELCDKGVWIDHGSQQALGPVSEVIDTYLESVNKNEAADTSAASTSAAQRPNADVSGRVLGSGEIRVTSLEYVDADGQTISFARTGESLTVRMHYSATEQIARTEFGLHFIHESGAHLAEPASGNINKSFTIEPGAGSVDFTVDRLTLQPGTFLISTGIGHRGHTYDYRDRMFELKVRTGRGGAPLGMVQLYGDWVLHDNSSSVGAGSR